jgi:hypothetical protein
LVQKNSEFIFEGKLGGMRLGDLLIKRLESLFEFLLHISTHQNNMTGKK